MIELAIFLLATLVVVALWWLLIPLAIGAVLLFGGMFLVMNINGTWDNQPSKAAQASQQVARENQLNSCLQRVSSIRVQAIVNRPESERTTQFWTSLDQASTSAQERCRSTYYKI